MEWTFSERKSITSSNSSMSFVVLCLAAQAALTSLLDIFDHLLQVLRVTWLQTGRARSLLSGPSNSTLRSKQLNRFLPYMERFADGSCVRVTHGIETPFILRSVDSTIPSS